MRLALFCSAATLIAVGEALPARAAAILNIDGQAGGISLVDTSTNPGVTCKFALPLISLNQQPALTNIVLSGPIVQPIVYSVADNVDRPRAGVCGLPRLSVGDVRLPDAPLRLLQEHAERLL